MKAGYVWILLFSVALVPCLSPRSASGIIVNGEFVNDGRCDALPGRLLDHELGVAPAFPVDEQITSVVAPAPSTTCIAGGTPLNDFLVTITNNSLTSWSNLYFVADKGVTVGNADGRVRDNKVGADHALSDSFRIDSSGVNAPLISESLIADEIFDPGEVWQFLVVDFVHPNGAGIFPVFDSPGAFSGSSAFFLPSFPSSASILAIPEPSVGALVLAGLGLLGLRGRGRRAS